jgi:hypothetical protein
LISGIDATAAAEMPGIFAIYTAHDLDDLVEPVRAPSRMLDYHATELYPTGLASDPFRDTRRRTAPPLIKSRCFVIKPPR